MRPEGTQITCEQTFYKNKPRVFLQVSLKVDHVVEEVDHCLAENESPVISLWETGQARTAKIFNQDVGEKTLKECSVLAATLRSTIELYADSMPSDANTSDKAANTIFGELNEDGTRRCMCCKKIIHTKDSLLRQLEKLNLPPPPLDMVRGRIISDCICTMYWMYSYRKICLTAFNETETQTCRGNYWQKVSDQNLL